MEIYDGSGFASIEQAQFMTQLKALERFKSVPFNDKSMAVLSGLSKRLLASPQAKHAPQLTALGFWLRSSQLKKMQREFEDSVTNASIRTSRGIAFHLPPQNVDTLFVYSWALSLLAGNANVVRVPSELSTLSFWLLQTICDSLAEFESMGSQIFCRYTLESSLNADISAMSDLRMIWGGDAKVQMVSKDPVRPDGLSLGFPDRKSFTVLSTASYADLDTNGRNHLANRLYNDIYWFDQMGCGSPRIIFWVGKASQSGPTEDLYQRLDNIAFSKQYDVETGVALSKFSYMNELIASEIGTAGTRISNRLSILKTEFNQDIVDKIQGGGMLLEVALNEVEDVSQFLDRQTQTITHFGLTPLEIEKLSETMVMTGGFRLVPVGEALSFEGVWDGLSLTTCMTRQITIRI